MHGTLWIIPALRDQDCTSKTIEEAETHFTVSRHNARTMPSEWWSAKRRWEHWHAPQSWQWRPNGSRKNASGQPRMSEPWCQAPARSNVVAPKGFAYCDSFTKPAGTWAVTASVGPATPATAKGNAQLPTLAPDPALAGNMVTVLRLSLARDAIPTQIWKVERGQRRQWSNGHPAHHGLSVGPRPSRCLHALPLQHETAQRDAKNCARRHCTQEQQGYHTT